MISSVNRKWYKLVNGVWEEAPSVVETDRAIIFNYNCDANEKQLREDGYLPENEINFEDYENQN